MKIGSRNSEKICAQNRFMISTGKTPDADQIFRSVIQNHPTRFKFLFCVQIVYLEIIFKNYKDRTTQLGEKLCTKS